METQPHNTQLLNGNLGIHFKSARQSQVKKTNCALELVTANKELKKAEDCQKKYILGLEKMMEMISHKVRQPIANILGISNLLGLSISSPDDFLQSVAYIKQSAINLDVFTKELTIFMRNLEQIGKK